jgi:hypothetical protein
MSAQVVGRPVMAAADAVIEVDGEMVEVFNKKGVQLTKEIIVEIVTVVREHINVHGRWSKLGKALKVLYEERSQMCADQKRIMNIIVLGFTPLHQAYYNNYTKGKYPPKHEDEDEDVTVGRANGKMIVKQVSGLFWRVLNYAFNVEKVLFESKEAVAAACVYC